MLRVVIELAPANLPVAEDEQVVVGVAVDLAVVEFGVAWGSIATRSSSAVTPWTVILDGLLNMPANALAILAKTSLPNSPRPGAHQMASGVVSDMSGAPAPSVATILRAVTRFSSVLITSS
jgi:hypothetical protein